MVAIDDDLESVRSRGQTARLVEHCLALAAGAVDGGLLDAVEVDVGIAVVVGLRPDPPDRGAGERNRERVAGGAGERFGVLGSAPGAALGGDARTGAGVLQAPVGGVGGVPAGGGGAAGRG